MGLCDNLTPEEAAELAAARILLEVNIEIGSEEGFADISLPDAARKLWPLGYRLVLEKEPTP